MLRIKQEAFKTAAYRKTQLKTIVQNKMVEKLRKYENFYKKMNSLFK